jgi:hypothetical protein
MNCHFRLFCDDHLENKTRAVAEPRLELEGPGLTLGSQYIDQKLELVQAYFEEARPSFLASS